MFREVEYIGMKVARKYTNNLVTEELTIYIKDMKKNKIHFIYIYISVVMIDTKDQFTDKINFTIRSNFTKSKLTDDNLG